MQAIPIQKAGPAESLLLRPWHQPQPEPNQILIKVAAFGVNFADVLARKGQYGDAPPMPFVPGYEVSGIVEAIGSEVTRFKAGDRVLALTQFGGYAEYAVSEELACFSLPEGFSFAQGASIPVNFVTAWHSIFETGSVQKSDKILIHAGAGGVGQAAIALALYAGLEIFATAGGPGKIEKLKELGVHHPIDYRQKDFVREVRNLAPEGIDLILDSVGGAQFKRELDLLKPHGRIVGYGAAAFADRGLSRLPALIGEAISMLTLSAVDLMMKSRGFYGVNMLQVAKGNPALFHREMTALLALFRENKLHTGEIHTFSASEVGRVHAALESRSTTGKFVGLFEF